jgi:D-alanyl-D-alanine carboxypeptidase/D-alanyl-D-alanine-endopeptidase (penicillin-binding protein 4)
MRRGVFSSRAVRALIVVLGIGVVGLIPIRHAPAEIPGSATLAASPSHVTSGQEVAFTGQVEAGPECSSGRIVELLRRHPGSDTWEAVGSTTAGVDGGFALALSPPHTALYEALVPSTDGDVPCAEIDSPIVSVTVAVAVTQSLASASVAAGECAALTVSISPDKTGQVIWIQRRRPNGWQRILTVSLREGSVVVARPCFAWGDLGSVAIRARWPSQDDLNETGTGSPVALQIVKARWMRRIDQLVGGIRMSVSVREAGSYLYQRRDGELRVPASNEKLLLSAALLDRLGPQFQMPVRAMARAAQDGVIHGNLWIVGRGDPTVSRVRLRRLARGVVDAGIRRIRGSVLGSQRYFSRDWWAPGWKRDFPRDEVALPTALTYRGNQVDGRHISDPERRAAVTLTRALRRLGVRVDGKPGSSRSPSGLVEVARVGSPPLIDLLRVMNVYSSNFFAEVLGKRLGVAGYGAPGTISKGAAATGAWAQAHGIRVTARDGSGLSYRNRVTARGLARLLGLAEREPWGLDLRRSLPAPGQGTLRHRLKGVLVRAKTGTLRRISALSGWVWLEHRQAWAEFSILSSGVSIYSAKAIEDKVVRILFERGR